MFVHLALYWFIIDGIWLYYFKNANWIKMMTFYNYCEVIYNFNISVYYLLISNNIC